MTRTLAVKWMLFSWKLTNWKDNSWHWLARRLPRRLRYWSIIVEASAMSGSPEHENEEVPAQRVMDVLKWMDR